MSYTIEDLVRIKMEAQELSNIAADYLGQMVYQLPGERNEKQIAEKVTRLQGKFSELHALMLGELESGDLSDIEQKAGNESGSSTESQGGTAQALRPQDYCEYREVCIELGEQGANEELGRVIKAGKGILKFGNKWGFIWICSPQGNEFWKIRLSRL